MTENSKIQPIDERDYHILLDSIESIWTSARSRAAQAINTQLLDANWGTGRHIVEFEQKGKVRAEYGQQLITRLSKDLTIRRGKGFSRSNLIYMRKLYICFPKSETLSHLLTWSHYFELLKCDDPLELNFYLHEAIKQKLLQASQYQTEGSWEKNWHDEIKENLRSQIMQLNDSHISVRNHWETVAYYRNPAHWTVLTNVGVENLKREVAPLLPTMGDNESALNFDMLILYVQLSLLDETFDATRYEGKITLIAQGLKKLGTVPQVMAKINLINEVLTPRYWENKSLSSIEHLRLELRDLLQFLTGKSGRTIRVVNDE